MSSGRKPYQLSIVKRFYPDVKRVEVARAPLTVEVLKSDGKGGRKSHQACAMADACKRKFHLDGTIVSRSVAYLIKGDTATKYGIPEAVRREITSFDRGAGFAPGTYHLVPPHKKKAGRSGGASTGVNRSYRKQVSGMRHALTGG
jgi:hypothetical protein